MMVGGLQVRVGFAHVRALREQNSGVQSSAQHTCLHLRTLCMELAARSARFFAHTDARFVSEDGLFLLNA